MLAHTDGGPMASSVNKLRVHIRWMIRRDMPEVLDIERQSFEFPWSEDDFVRCLRQRNCIGMVAEHGDRVVGFMIYELHKTRLHILEFRRGAAVPPPRRSARRWCTSWSASFPASAAPDHAGSARDEPDGPALLPRTGFRARNVLRDFYDDTPEDAYLMQFLHEVEPIGLAKRRAG